MKKLLIVCCIAFGCKSSSKIAAIKETAREPDNAMQSSTSIFAKGYPAFDAKQINYEGRDNAKLQILFKEPVVIGVASKPEKWGYFQFPSIGRRAGDGSIQVRWNMTRDAIEAYGEDKFGVSISTDNGKTFRLQDSAQTTGSVLLPNGDMLEIYTPTPIKENELALPKPVGTGLENYRKSNFTFYRLHDLPQSRQGVFFKRLKKGETEWKIEQATLVDPQAARYSLAGLVPIVWWGDIRVAKDGSLVAGIYPGFLIDEKGLTDPRSGVFFYRSTDNGHSWQIQGRIPYDTTTVGDSLAAKRGGYSEPAFEVLNDGTFLCVMRTTDGVGIGPMFASYSTDEGKTWTKPTILAATGVMPRLLRLGNGVLVMASGRPGVQLRFSADEKGRKWTMPFEMLPYGEVKKELSGGTAAVSCGYTGLLPLGKNKFLIAYSDFNYKTESGDIRKAIKVREVVVNP
ncbi:MAG: exo-alpha-sialidase [Chitinophagaceae bacterium]|nr:MAG: exo-alpha-sialidase [Chitinophagaceae bacterium]